MVVFFNKHCSENVMELLGNGLWLNLNEAGITPDLDNSINQQQEQYQKNYIGEKPEIRSMNCSRINGYTVVRQKE